MQYSATISSKCFYYWSTLRVSNVITSFLLLYLCLSNIANKSSTHGLLRCRIIIPPASSNLPINDSDDFMSALGTAAPLDLGLTAHYQFVSMPHHAQSSNKNAVRKTFSGLYGCTGDHSLSLLLNDTKIMVADHNVEIKDADLEKKAQAVLVLHLTRCSKLQI